MAALDFLKNFGWVSKSEYNALKAEIEKVYTWMGSTAGAQQWTMPDPYIFANQMDLYRLDPNLGTAVDMLARDVAISEFNVKRRVGERTKDITNHPFELLLYNPNPMDSRMEFIRDTVSNYVFGNSYWWLNRKSFTDTPKEMWAIPPHMIEPIPDERAYLKGYAFHPGGGKEPVPMPTWEICHFKTYNPFNRFVGLSPVESLIETIVADLGMRKTRQRTYTEQNGQPPSLLGFKDFIPNEAWDDVKKETRAAAIRDEMLMLRGVGDGVTWLSRAMSNKDAEYLENLRQNMRDIFNRVCPGLLSMLDSDAKYSNAESGRGVYDESLWGVMMVLSSKITKEILPAYGRNLTGTFDDPRKTDRQVEMSQFDRDKEIMLISELRELKGLDPIGDERDNLFVGEIRTRVYDRQVQQEEPQQDEPEQPQQEQPEEMPEANKAAVDALYKWRKQIAGGRMEKAKVFTNPAIPAKLEAAIKARLHADMDAAGILALVDKQIERLKPRADASGNEILRGIEASLKAMELNR